MTIEYMSRISKEYDELKRTKQKNYEKITTINFKAKTNKFKI